MKKFLIGLGVVIGVLLLFPITVAIVDQVWGMSWIWN